MTPNVYTVDLSRLIEKVEDVQDEDDDSAQIRILSLTSIADDIVDSLSEEHNENQIQNAIEDITLRFGWKQNDQCRVWSRSDGKWCDGHIVDIVTNMELITVKYEEQKEQIQRFSTNVMPTGMDKEYQCNKVIIECILDEMGISYDDNDPISLVTDYFYDFDALFFCVHLNLK